MDKIKIGLIPLEVRAVTFELKNGTKGEGTEIWHRGFDRVILSEGGFFHANENIASSELKTSEDERRNIQIYR